MTRSLAPADAQVVPLTRSPEPGHHELPEPDLAAPAGLAYRRDGGRPDQADSGEGTAAPPRTEREVVMTAHDSSHHAERRDIGEATLEQLRADVTHLAHNLVTAPLLTMFRELRR